MLPLHHVAENMQNGQTSLLEVKALRDDYPEAVKIRDKVPSHSLSRVLRAFLKCTTIQPISPPHAFQDKNLPFDRALASPAPASLLNLLQPGSADCFDGIPPLNVPLASVAEIRVFESLSHLLDPNPRRLKRIISVYALATQVAKRMPLSEGGTKARLMCASAQLCHALEGAIRTTAIRATAIRTTAA